MKWRVAALLGAACAALAASALAATSDRGAARAGARWLERAVGAAANGQAADALVALRATGSLRRDEAARRATALRRGAVGYARTAGATGKVIIGLAASGVGNPRCAGRTDMQRRLAGFGRAGRYGRTAWDHALGMLAFRALGQRPPQSTIRFLLGTRGSGGWNFTLSRSARDDVTHTALAILALRAAGVARSHGALRAAARWLRAQRTRSGGYALGRRDRNEANSTALAILAQRALGARDPRAVRALRALQRPDGAFQFTATDSGSRTIASTDAVLALSGRVPPVGALRRPGRGC